MINVNINGKTYKNIESFTIGKLEHILQLAIIAVDNYKDAIKHYPPDRMEKCGKPYLARLEQNQKLIENELSKRK